MIAVDVNNDDDEDVILIQAAAVQIQMNVNLLVAENIKRKSLVLDEIKNHKEKKTRHVNARADYWNSTWGRMLRDADITNPSKRTAKLFRRRFRVSFPLYLPPRWLNIFCILWHFHPCHQMRIPRTKGCSYF